MEYQYNVNKYSFNGNDQHALVPHATSYASNPVLGAGKKSFLVIKRNKYMAVPTETIAFFYIKYESTVIVTFDKQEYSVNYSLEQIQQLVSDQQYFRVNRQYLINFNAIKEVEHYFARKLLVIPTIPFPDKLVVSKERASNLLDWLENR